MNYLWPILTGDASRYHFAAGTDKVQSTRTVNLISFFFSKNVKVKKAERIHYFLTSMSMYMINGCRLKCTRYTNT